MHVPANHKIADNACDDWSAPVAFEDLDGLEGEGLRNEGATDKNRYSENQHGRRILGETSCSVTKVKRTLRPELQEKAARDSKES